MESEPQRRRFLWREVLLLLQLRLQQFLLRQLLPFRQVQLHLLQRLRFALQVLRVLRVLQVLQRLLLRVLQALQRLLQVLREPLRFLRLRRLLRSPALVLQLRQSLLQYLLVGPRQFL